jgi:predicted ATPase/DNA-binding SARP family transcriptional activator
VALLAYLAITGESHSRDTLATLLWPEQDQSRARAGLRAALATLKKALGEGWLDLDRESAGLSPEVASSTSDPSSAPERERWLDVAEFRGRLAECRTHDHPEEQVCPDCLSILAEAAELYRDDFLAGFTLRDSPAFDEWQFFQTEGLRNELLGALASLAHGYAERGELEPAILHARRWAALDPLHEPAHRQLMRLYARFGQRAAALRQYRKCVRVLQEELSVSPEPETVQLYETIKGNRELPPAEDRTVAAVTGQEEVGSRPRVAHNLPVQVTVFVGRERELAEIHQRLADPDCRLLTLTGPGGTGKTRLAIQAAQDLIEAPYDRPDFPQGAYYVPLASVGEAEMLVPAIANALDFPFYGVGDPKEQLLNYLRGRTLLLLLDSLEHLLEGIDLLTDLLTAAPGIKILATSREALNVRREWLYPVEGLGFPAAAEVDGAEAGDLESYGAVELFVASAHRASPGFSLSAEKQWVTRICQLVEGMPLAIELAAAWLRQMPNSVIVQELETGIDLLTSSLRDTPERHRSMRAVFEQSWQLLSEEERAVLRKLSLFRGGFHREAAERVTGASLELLSALVDKSLIRVDPTGRYELHELLRQFAAERLQQYPTEAEATRGRHGSYYLASLQQQERHLKGPKLMEALAAIRADISNVRLAWRWAIEQDKWRELKGAMESLFLFYQYQGRGQEGNDVYARAVARLRSSYERPATAGAAVLRGEIDLILGTALAYLGAYRSGSGLAQHEQAKKLGQESLALLRAAGPAARRETAFSLAILGNTVVFLDEVGAAIELLQESCVLFDEVGDQWGKAFASRLLGQHTQRLGRYDEAERHLQQSMAIFETIGEQRFIVHTTAALGRVAWARGQNVLAETLHQDCLERQTALGDRLGMAVTFKDLGHVARSAGEYAQAEEYYGQGIAISREIGLRGFVGICLLGLGVLAEIRGDYAEAERLIQESKVLDPALRSDLFLGWVVLGRGDLPAAERYFHGVLESAVKASWVPAVLHALTGLAHLRARAGEPDYALELLALIVGHPASHQEFSSRATLLEAELRAELPPEVVERAQWRGRARDLDATAAELLSELGQEEESPCWTEVPG